MAQNINLYAAGRKRRALFSRAGLLAIALAGVACVAALSALETRRRDELRTAAREANDTAARLEKRIAAAPLGALRAQEELKAAEAEVLALESVAARLGSGLLGHTTGFTQALRALARGSTEGVWLTGVRIDNLGAQLALEGKSLDAARVPQLIERLRKAPHFAGTEFATIEMKPAEEAGQTAPPSLVRFRLATPVPPAQAGSGAKR